MLGILNQNRQIRPAHNSANENHGGRTKRLEDVQKIVVDTLPEAGSLEAVMKAR
jgi:hypothetical protein